MPARRRGERSVLGVRGRPGSFERAAGTAYGARRNRTSPGRSRSPFLPGNAHKRRTLLDISSPVVLAVAGPSRACVRDRPQPSGRVLVSRACAHARARARTRTQPVTETAARQRKQLGARNYGFVRGTKRTSGRGYRRQTWKLAGPTRAGPLALGRDRKLLLDRIEIFILIFHNDELNVGLELGWMKIVRLCEAFHWASQILFYSHILFYLFYFNWVINTQYINWVFKSFGQFLEFTVGIE